MSTISTSGSDSAQRERSLGEESRADNVREPGRGDLADSDLRPRVWPWLVRWFRRYIEGYLGRHFHTVSLSRGPRPEIAADEPLVIYVNHPAWWDPLLGLLLSGRYFSDRAFYAPIQAEALKKYRFFERLGFFGVETGTLRGAVQFVRISRSILSERGTSIWLTPEGRFTDPRDLSVPFQPGLAHLAHVLDRGVFLPVAFEYPFWEESRPEALVRFGEPLRVADFAGLSKEEWGRRLEAALRQTQRDLAAASLARDPAAFEVLVRGRSGVGGVYDRLRQARAWLGGRQFRPEHGEKLT